jgi:uncharacterized membrane protein YukC
LAEENLKLALNQNQDLATLEEQSKNFEKMARDFSNNTKTVKKKMRWENRKWLILGILASAVLALIIYIKFF